MRPALVFSLLLFGVASLARGETLVVEGMVSDDDGHPLAGAQVRLLEHRARILTPEDCAPYAEAETTSDGLFSLRADVPSTPPLALYASAPGFRLARFPFPREHAFRKVALALEPGSSIAGRVTDPEGKPVPGALLGPVVGTDSRSVERVVPQWTRSGADGSFLFDGLPPNVVCRFRVRARGYQTSFFTAHAGERQVHAVLAEGGWEIRGRVAQGEEPPPAGTRVLVKGTGLEDAVSVAPDGEFALSGLPEGEYTLQAVPPQPRAARAVSLLLPQDAATTWALEVSDGYTVSGTTVDAETSTPAEGVLLRFEEPDGVRQEVMSGAGGLFRAGPFFQEQLPRMTVAVEGGFRSAASLGDSSDPPPSADGFEDVENWTVRVRRQRTLEVTLDNVHEATQPVVLTLHGPEGPHGRSERTLVTSSTTLLPAYTRGTYYLWGTSGGLATAVHDLRFGRDPGASVTLSLRPASTLQGRLLVQHGDGSTSPALRHSVRLFLAGETTSPLQAAAQSSDTLAREWLREFREVARLERPEAQGFFSFSRLASGRYVVEAENGSGTSRRSREVVLQPGAAEQVEFVFPAGKEISGTVTRPGGEVVHGATVRIRIRGGGAGAGRELLLHTSEEGAFRATDVEAEELESLLVELHGFSMDRVGPMPLPAEDLRIVLKKQGLLRARVEAPPSTRWRLMLMAAEPWRDRACPEQLISRVSGWPLNVQGEEEGEFEVPPNGRYRVVAVGQGGRVAVSEPFTWAAGDDTDRQIILYPEAAGSLSGTYQGSENVEVTAWNTTLPEEPGVEAEFKTTGSGGQFTFAGLAPGDYLVSAAGEMSYSLASNVQVTAGGNTTVHLSSEQEKGVSGTVRLNGTPVPGAALQLISQTDPGAPALQTQSGAGGEFTFQEVAPDEYILQASVELDGRSRSRAVAVVVERQGQVHPVVVELSEPSAVSVSASELAPAGYKAGSAVTFRNAQTGETVPGKTTPDGSIEAPLAPGSYDVWLDGEPAGRAEVDAGGGVRISR